MMKMTNQEAIRVLKGIKNDVAFVEINTPSCSVKRWPIATFNAFKAAFEALEKQIPKPPIPDMNATDRFGKAVPRCQVCGYALDLQIEQYCPCCGQRLTEYEVKECQQ